MKIGKWEKPNTGSPLENHLPHLPRPVLNAETLRDAAESLKHLILRQDRRVQEAPPVETPGTGSGSTQKNTGPASSRGRKKNLEVPKPFPSEVGIPSTYAEVEGANLSGAWNRLSEDDRAIVLEILKQPVAPALAGTTSQLTIDPRIASIPNNINLNYWKEHSLAVSQVDVATLIFRDTASIGRIELYSATLLDGTVLKFYKIAYNRGEGLTTPNPENPVQSGDLNKIFLTTATADTSASMIIDNDSTTWNVTQYSLENPNRAGRKFELTPPDNPTITDEAHYHNPLLEYYDGASQTLANPDETKVEIPTAQTPAAEPAPGTPEVAASEAATVTTEPLSATDALETYFPELASATNLDWAEMESILNSVKQLLRGTRKYEIGSNKNPNYLRVSNESTTIQLTPNNPNEPSFDIEILYNSSDPNDNQTKIVKISQKNPDGKIAAQLAVRIEKNDDAMDDTALHITSACLTLFSEQRKVSSVACTLVYEGASYIYGPDPQNSKIRKTVNGQVTEFEDTNNTFTDWAKMEIESLTIETRNPVVAAEKSPTHPFMQKSLFLSAGINYSVLSATDSQFDFASGTQSQGAGPSFGVSAFLDWSLTDRLSVICATGLQARQRRFSNADVVPATGWQLGLSAKSYLSWAPSPSFAIGLGGGWEANHTSLKGNLTIRDDLVMAAPYTAYRNWVFPPSVDGYLQWKTWLLEANFRPYSVDGFYNTTHVTGTMERSLDIKLGFEVLEF